MVKKALKWTFGIIGTILLIIIIFYAVVYFKTESRINKVYTINPQKLTIPTDSASYAAGKHIAQNRGCLGCHGHDLAGGRAFADEESPIGLLYASNITSGKGGVNYNEEDWIRVLRHGLNKENKPVWFMPSHELYKLSNQDMAALISYVKQQPAVDKTVPGKSIKPLGRILTFLGAFPLLPAEKIDHEFKYKDSMPVTVSAEYGAYLAVTCEGCHGEKMKGGEAHGPKEPRIPDVTTTSVVGRWKDSDFITAFRTGKTPEGRLLTDYMPWKEFTYTDDELKAIYLYLHELK